MANIVKGQIGNALESVAPDGIVATADAIYDETKGKSQEQINEDTKQSLAEQANNIGYYECDTAAATAAKEITGGSYKLPDAAPYGGSIKVKFKYKNSAANPTLSIDGSPAKPLYYNDSIASSTNTWEDGDVLDLYYDGTNFNSRSVVEKFATGEKVKEVGIDTEPTAGSDNLVKSGGVIKTIILKNYEFNEQVTGTATELTDMFGSLPIGTTFYVNENSVKIRFIWTTGGNTDCLPGTTTILDKEILRVFAIGEGRANFIINPSTVLGSKIVKLAVTENQLDNDVFYKLNLLEGYSLNETQNYTSASGGANWKLYNFNNRLLIKDGQKYNVTVTCNNIVWLTNAVRIFINSARTSDPNTHIIPANSTKYSFTASGDITGIKLLISDAVFVEGATDADATILIETNPYEVILPSDSVSFNMISFKQIIPTSKNLLDPNLITTGYYINADTGALVPATSLYVTPYFKVDKRGLYFNRAEFAAGVLRNVGSVVYNPDKTFKRRLSSQYVYQDGDENCLVRYTGREETLSSAQVEIGTKGTEWVPYTSKEVIDPNFLPPEQITDDDINNILLYVNNELNENKIFNQHIDIDLPDTIYAVRGDVLQLFFQGMIKALNVENYNIVVSCPVGKQFHRYYEYECPSDAELNEYTFSITVRDNNKNILGQKSCILKVVDSPVSPATNTNILCIGDSLTDDGEWPCEANRRLSGQGGTPVGNEINNITFIGRLSKTIDNITTNFEGEAGYGWRDFVEGRSPKFRFYLDNLSEQVYIGDVYSITVSENVYNYTIIEIGEIVDNKLPILTSTTNINNIPPTSGTLTKVSGGGSITMSYSSFSSESDNVFWDSNKNRISFKHYIEDVCGYPEGTNIDAIYTLLSWNQIQGGGINLIPNYIKIFANTLRTEYPNAKFKLMAVQYPSMKLMMPGYGASGNNYADVYNTLNLIYNMNQMYQNIANSNEHAINVNTGLEIDDVYSDFIEFVNVSSQFDSDYNNPYTLKNVNTRNSLYQEPKGNDVHPTIYGYYQIADVAYRNIVANFCQ